MSESQVGDDGDTFIGMSLPTVSVVMSTQTRISLLTESIGVLVDDPATTEIIVVVDGGTDEVWAQLQSLCKVQPALRCIRTDYGNQLRTLQTGVEAATGDVIVILDDDVVPSPGLVAGHAKWHTAENRDLVVLGYMPVHRSPTTKLAAITRDMYGRGYEYACVKYEDDADQVLRRMWMGNVSIRRSNILRVGLPGTVTGYSNDFELGLRLKASGLTGVFDRSLRAEHRYERSLPRMLADQRSSGFNQMLVQADWPEEVPQAVLVGSVARLDRLLLQVARGDRTRGLVVLVLAAIAKAAAIANLTPLAVRLLQSATTIQQRRGMAEAHEIIGLRAASAASALTPATGKVAS